MLSAGIAGGRAYLWWRVATAGEAGEGWSARRGWEGLAGQGDENLPPSSVEARSGPAALAGELGEQG